MSQKIDVSVWTITRIILVLLLFYLVFLIRDIIALFFFVLILAVAFNPLINKWEKRIRRGPAVLVLMLIIFLATASVIYLIVPPFISQLSQLINQAPHYLTKYDNLRDYTPTIKNYLSNFSQSLTKVTGSFLTITLNVFGGVFTILTAIVITAYLLLDKEAFTKFFVSVLPSGNKEAVVGMFDKIGQKLSNWVQGQVLLGLIVGTLDLIGLEIIGIPYALSLAVIAAFLEVVPTLGPILAGLIATLVALAVSPVQAIFVAVLFIVVQQIENNFIVPKVMQKAVGLSPVIIIFAILVGAKLLGILGAILAVPVAGSLAVIIQEWATVRKAFAER